jgi:uncharacterized protein (TIGR03435 family)
MASRRDARKTVNAIKSSGCRQTSRRANASNFFEVDARAAGETTPSMDDARAMLRALLADRFLLRAHHDPRDARIYALTVAKGGPKMTPCSNPNAASIFSPGLLLSCTPPMPIARIVQLLSREAGRPVVDKTGLTGTLTFELRWLPEGAPSQLDSPPALFTAIQEQCGLKLAPPPPGTGSPEPSACSPLLLAVCSGSCRELRSTLLLVFLEPARGLELRTC